MASGSYRMPATRSTLEGSAFSVDIRDTKRVATRKTIDCWLRLRARWAAEAKPAPLGRIVGAFVAFDFRTKALGRAIYRQLKRLVTVLLLFLVKPHHEASAFCVDIGDRSEYLHPYQNKELQKQ